MAPITWTDSVWQAGVSEWINAQLRQLSLQPATALEQVTDSPTSGVWSCRSAERLIYFKATTSPFTFEPQLTHTLVELLPSAVPPVLAIEMQWGWMLSADAGTTLCRLTLAEDKRVIEGALAHWHAMLTHYAVLQQAALPHLAALEASGCPSRRLAQLLGLYRTLIADTPILTAGEGDALTQAQINRLPAFATEVERLCMQLAAYDIPETLHHDDLGANNVLFDGQTYRFLDWAESCITHPFCSLTIVLRYARYVVRWDDATLNALRDSYLSAWLGYAPMDKLLEVWMLAHRLSKLCRALTWYSVASHLDGSAKIQAAGSTSYWLRLFVEDVDD